MASNAYGPASRNPPPCSSCCLGGTPLPALPCPAQLNQMDFFYCRVLDYLLQSSERIHSMERLLDEVASAVKGMEGYLAAKQALSVQLQGERCFVALGGLASGGLAQGMGE